MKTATIRDLRYNFPKLEAWLRNGEEIQITKHNKPVAKLVKDKDAAPPPARLTSEERLARIRRTWKGRVFSAQEVEEMRAFETGEP
ncbi:antitoxin (DNA-binding transcriptional repressor) of toxin-antitoxin stability system [Prosthecobacter fusiformis]|uniref:Antitoxin (DNA-binding transcriptional repressor) of toxin-antitoxin stability system n=1 Tax=Prosthecobacter fusiformis TaxID=48464 RepID=A0A4R7RR34_9BACT|nr:type II toxin-antitoxin system Phd/YefM family antitoxin [Prosthecobacter fusiformis]TDU68030.1 antitoxin (DNA-binding transcriptional repressor) of toxin-antitoxin stability system [Prosthecobacter fusiformis]